MINKTYASQDSLVHKEYKNLCFVFLELAKQHDAVETKGL